MAQIAGHTFSLLLSEHTDLTCLFEKHQRALFSKDIGTALAAITRFGNELKRHIDYEENVLLPLYSAKGAETEGGTLTIFNAEHRKLKDTADNLARKTAAIYASSDMLGSILKLLDEETLFKGLFDHHALREQNILFPRLDAVTSEAERERALEEHFA
jgi:hemerythrin-like domain-containing protein